MDWKSSRLWVCLIAMGLSQWGLIAGKVSAQEWMAVVMVALGAFGIAKTVEYAKSGRVETTTTTDPDGAVIETKK